MHSVLKSLLFVGSVALVSCGDDDGAISITPDAGEQTSDEDASTNDDETTTSSTASSDDTTTTREGPWGCYLQESHVCDCAIKSEAECEDVGLWVEGCASCVVTTEDAGSDAAVATDAATPEVGPGCYDPATHACACDSNESDCATADGVWADECACPVTSVTDGSTPTDDSGAVADASNTTDPAPTGPGCYDPVVHQCACDTDESTCTAADGVWADECACPLGDAPASDAGVNGDSGITADTTIDSTTTTADSATTSESQDAAVADASTDPSIGCYIPADTQCNCEIVDESACDQIEGIWTPGCTSCIVDAAL